MHNLNDTNIEDIIKVFDDVDVLKQLAKTWRYFSDFRISCLRLEKTEEILSILSVISSAAELENKDIFSGINVLSPDFIILKELIDVDYKSGVLKKSLKHFGINNIKIEKDYDNFLKCITKTDIDSMLKFVILYSYTLKYCQNNKNLMRIISLFIFKHLNIMNRPILYPLSFINTDMMLEEVNTYSSIAILKTFEAVCRFGEHTIEMIDESIHKLKSGMNNIKELKKFSDSKYFYYIFSKLYIRINDFMNDLGIKRDKAARLLARLVKQGYLKEQKSGKEKTFINVYMITFLENATTK